MGSPSEFASYMRGLFMFSARATCPECKSPTAVEIADLLNSPLVDFFRCSTCFNWWMVPKGKDGPATRVIFGDPDWTANVHKAG